MENKKVLLYAGGALVLGAITFFVWSFFQKTTIPIAEKEDSKDESPTGLIGGSKNPRSNYFSSLPTTFEPIATPNVFDNFKL